ncbi:hypothetical protein [Pseudarthrobacter sp. NPDC080039]
MTTPAVEATIHKLMELAGNVVYDLLEKRVYSTGSLWGGEQRNGP